MEGEEQGDIKMVKKTYNLKKKSKSCSSKSAKW